MKNKFIKNALVYSVKAFTEIMFINVRSKFVNLCRF